MQGLFSWFETLVPTAKGSGGTSYGDQEWRSEWLGKSRSQAQGSLPRFQQAPTFTAGARRIDLGDDEQPRGLVPQQMASTDLLQAISLAPGLAVAKTLSQSRGR